jgi:DNA-binding transcriptional regulator PaaX
MTIEIKQEPKVANIIAIKAKPRRREQLSKLLNRKSGATISQLQSAFGWQRYTARAALSTLRKAGTAIERSDTDKGSVYRIVSEA